jgi:RNA polymerase sigma-70 factor (ECF subfamily)
VEQLEAMYTAYKPLLLAMAYRMLGSLTDAEDIVQDVFVSMQQVSVDEVRHFKAYLVSKAASTPSCTS